MPTDFIGLLTENDFYMLSGVAGILSAFVILMIWSRGL